LSEKQATQVRECFQRLFKDAGFYKAISRGTNGKSATQYRLRTADLAVQECLKVHKV
jgi:hypothetical protein